MFDLDGSGCIEPIELMQLAQVRRELGQQTDIWTEEHNRIMLRKLDTDEDGLVSCLEFVEHFDRSVCRSMIVTQVVTFCHVKQCYLNISHNHTHILTIYCIPC